MYQGKSPGSPNCTVETWVKSVLESFALCLQCKNKKFLKREKKKLKGPEDTFKNCISEWLIKIGKYAK